LLFVNINKCKCKTHPRHQAALLAGFAFSGITIADDDIDDETDIQAVCFVLCANLNPNPNPFFMVCFVFILYSLFQQNSCGSTGFVRCLSRAKYTV
jgi:hypothetical protein